MNAFLIIILILQIIGSFVVMTNDFILGIVGFLGIIPLIALLIVRGDVELMSDQIDTLNKKIESLTKNGVSPNDEHFPFMKATDIQKPSKTKTAAEILENIKNNKVYSWQCKCGWWNNEFEETCEKCGEKKHDS